jgi:hypothetical protein
MQSKFKTNSNLNNCIHQLYSYMIINNTKYGLLSIYKYTIFFQISFDLRGTSDLGNARVKVDMLSFKFSYEKNS